MVKHAKLAPSSAERWVNCPGSLMFNDLPGKETVYSKEGTLAHEAAEKALYNAPLDNNTYSDEMIAGAQLYKKAIDDFWANNNLKLNVWEAEKPVQLQLITTERGIGRVDYFGTGENCILIADYKFGMEKVEVTDNLQLWLYMAAYVTGKQAEHFSFKDYSFCIMIVQPRLNSVEIQIKNYRELAEIARFLNMAAKRALIEEKLPVEYRTFYPCKKCCQYCKGSGQCAAEAEANLNYMAIKEKFDNNILESADLSRIYTHLPDVKKYIENVENVVKDKLSAGESIPGFKMVQGRHLPKRWVNEESAIEFLKGQNLEEKQIFTYKIITPTAAEKLCDKADFKEFAKLGISSPFGNPVIVPESDKREAIKINNNVINTENDNEF
jgi:hypothetical protein